MDIKPIETEEDCRATLREIELLMIAEPGTPEGKMLDVLVTLVEASTAETSALAANTGHPSAGASFVI